MQARMNTLSETAQALKQGKPAIYPTDTVYGIGVAVTAAPAPDVLYELKRREARKPIAWLVGGLGDLQKYGKHVPESVLMLARTFWPGALTLVVNASDEVPPTFQSAAGTIGVRMPASDTALELISQVGCPLATTSANFSGSPAPRSLAELDADLVASVAATLADADDAAKSGIASTVLDCTGDHPKVLREGAITLADIRALS
jgi:L-threonylcarbamoyladenylate synthase